MRSCHSIPGTPYEKRYASIRLYDYSIMPGQATIERSGGCIVWRVKPAEERTKGMKRREFLKATTTSIAAAAFAAPAAAQISATTFLVCTGAWSAGWSWKKMHPLMTAAGHRLIVPTYTGLGEREHLAST